MKRVISIILTAVMLIAAVPVEAATWITLSKWAYNDVSNFKKEGLLPDSMESITDYTQNVTRLQFAELLYAVLERAQVLREYTYARKLNDTDNHAAIILHEIGIMVGTIKADPDDNTLIFNDDTIDLGKANQYNFYPDRVITREEMGAIIDRVIRYYCDYTSEDDDKAAEPKDVNEISDWAKTGVCKMLELGIISGYTDGTFRPKQSLTIEQAISLIYRVSNRLPTAPEADGANITAEEETPIQTYSNGLTETKKGDRLYLKQADKTLMEFETDIYSNIYSATVDNTVYAIAQNCYGKTDVYNAMTKELLFKLPYPVTLTDNLEEYIVTKSSNAGPMTFGIYDYSGKEILKPEYSLEEIEALRKNGFKPLQTEYSQASGWIYYSDWNDGGHLYKMDSNGEHKQKLSDNYCAELSYVDGWIYYFTAKGNDNSPLYRVRNDGTCEEKLTDNKVRLCDGGFDEHYICYDGIGLDYMPQRSKEDVLYDGDWIYYIEYKDDHTKEMWRVSSGDGETKKERFAEGYQPQSTSYKDGKIYFLDFPRKEEANSGDEDNRDMSGDLYSYDGEEIKKLNGDLSVLNYGFHDDKLLMYVGRNYNESANNEWYIADIDGSSAELWQEGTDAARRQQAQEDAKNGQDTYLYDNFSDDKFKIYGTYYWSIDDDEKELPDDEEFIVDSDGNKTVLPKDITDGYIVYRINDTLYYINHGGEINSYDMNTGEIRLIADNVYECGIEINTSGSDWFTYTDYSHNTWRYDASTDTLCEMFPNSNLHRYSKVYKMLGLNIGMYKVDEDGHYSFVTDDYAAYCIYVENGSKTGKHF